MYNKSWYDRLEREGFPKDTTRRVDFHIFTTPAGEFQFRIKRKEMFVKGFPKECLYDGLPHSGCGDVIPLNSKNKCDEIFEACFAMAVGMKHSEVVA